MDRSGLLGSPERRSIVGGAVACGSSLPRGALQEAGGEEPEGSRAAQEEDRPAAGKAPPFVHNLVHFRLAQIPGDPLDPVGGPVGVPGGRGLALLAQLL